VFIFLFLVTILFATLGFPTLWLLLSFIAAALWLLEVERVEPTVRLNGWILGRRRN
jgi:hypothetical protein